MPWETEWLPAWKDVSPEAKERPLLEPLPSNVTENTGPSATVICKCSHELY
jgi:hypothetical protein